MEAVKTFLKNKNNQIIVVIAVVILIAAIVWFFKAETVDFFSTGLKAFSKDAKDYLLQHEGDAPEVGGNQDFGAQYGDYSAVEPKDVSKPEELLPKAELSEEVKASIESDLALVGDNYLSAGMYAGVNTVQATLKNANLDIRAAPSIPVQENVSPWGVSTFEADTNGLALA
jgi:hypothetical protein